MIKFEVSAEPVDDLVFAVNNMRNYILLKKTPSC